MVHGERGGPPFLQYQVRKSSGALGKSSPAMTTNSKPRMYYGAKKKDGLNKKRCEKVCVRYDFLAEVRRTDVVSKVSNKALGAHDWMP